MEINNFGDAINRWSRLGPYYAMFPFDFAVEVISKYSSPGNYVCDPFAGRGTSVYASTALGRNGIGIEIFPVGWVYAKAKLAPANPLKVIARLEELMRYKDDFIEQAETLPEFFHYCFSKNVRSFLLSAQYHLHWKNDPIDTTLMAFILLYLHGKIGEGLSNQMRQTKAFSPDYSIRWWKSNNFISPPEIDCQNFLLKRIIWRYKYGIPQLSSGKMLLGDSTKIIPKIAQSYKKSPERKVSLLFTSPPYYNVTNYFYDQWLRLWLLGDNDKPQFFRGKYEGKFSSKDVYEDLLNNVFSKCVNIMSDSGVIYIRTDAREYTFQTTLKILRENYPKWNLEVIPAPVTGKTQTDLFTPLDNKSGEMDIILKGPKYKLY